MLRVLIKNGVRPILMIALTNHALDHLLAASLDADITTNIVRLGSRSADERISKYNLEEMEQVAGRSRLDREFGANYRELKTTQKEIVDLMEAFLRKHVTSEETLNYLQTNYPDLFEGFHNPTPWIATLHVLEHQKDGGGDWNIAGSRGRIQDVDDSSYAYWRMGGDLEFLARPPAPPRPAPDIARKPAYQSQNHFSVLSMTGNDADGSRNGDQDEDSYEEESSDADDDAAALEKMWRAPLDLQYSISSTTGNDSDASRDGDEDDDSDDQDNNDADDTASSEDTRRARLDLHAINDNVSIAAVAAPERPKKAIDIADLHDPRVFFAHLGYNALPSIPTSDRSLEQILEDEPDIWSLSRAERGRLQDYLTREVRLQLHETQLEEFERLRARHADVLERYNEGKNEVRRRNLALV